MDKEDQELSVNFALEATRVVAPGDESWVAYRDRLMALYAEREEHVHDFWTTPQGSIERADYEVYNRRYLAELKLWNFTLSTIVFNHKQGQWLSFQTVYDAVQLREMESQFA